MYRLSSSFVLGGVISISLLSLSTPSVDVLGDFSATTNDPGYLSFAPSAPSYKGNLDLPDVIEGVSVETRMPARLLYEEYVDPETRLVKPEAVRSAQEAFEATHAAHLKAYCIKETLEEDEALDRVQAEQSCRDVPDALRRKWEARRDFAAYRFVTQRLNAAYRLSQTLAEAHVTIDHYNEDRPEVAAFKLALFDALEVHQCLRLDHAGLTERSDGLRSIVSLVRNHLRKHRLEAGRPEAANLLVPATLQAQYPHQRFFSPAQLDAYQGDIGLLDPPNSGFWRKPTWAIGAFSMTDYHRLGLSSLQHHHDENQFTTIDEQAEAILDSTVPVRVVYERDDLEGRTPKMTVKLGGQNWKLKYVTDKRNTGRQRNPSKIYQKRWLGSEVNVEPVVNHLAAAIGYTVDPTYYQEKVYLYFEDKVYEGPEQTRAARFLTARDRMIEDLAATYPAANVASAFQHVGIDTEGRRYIEIRSTTLEKKSDAASDINLGYFTWGGFGKSFKREFRAFGVFLAWIGDPDIKDANVKAKLVPVTEADGSTGYRLAYSASDMGGGLGTGLPNLFEKDLVHAVERDWHNRPVAVHLTYHSIFPAPMLASASLSDARWIARMIGQLTRAQIVSAFRYAGCPEVVAHYYTEILLRRRDQLLDALGLMDTTVTDAAGQPVRLEPLSRMHNPGRFRVEGFESYFRRGYLRDRGLTLYDSSETFFPRYWHARYPWQF